MGRLSRLKSENMANCNKLFKDFIKAVSLTKSKKDALIKARSAVETTIEEYFKDKDGVNVPKFYIQGSYIMRTLVIKKDGTYDVDLGVYFLEKPTVEAKTVQGYVKDALKDQTSTAPEHKQRCIRVIYSGDFNIDLPVYYMEDVDTYPSLAVKDDGWEESDPKELRRWFDDHKDDNGQLCRMVKCLKVWCDNLSFKAPSGIAISVWAANYYSDNERDDQALSDLLNSVKDNIDQNGTCMNPKTPFDNLTSKLDSTQVEKFIEALKAFAGDAKEAISTNNQLEASERWQKHLGEKFPDGEDEDADAKQESLNKIKAMVLGGSAKLSSEGKIQEKDGVKHKPHKNYGG